MGPRSPRVPAPSAGMSPSGQPSSQQRTPDPNPYPCSSDPTSPTARYWSLTRLTVCVRTTGPAPAKALFLGMVTGIPYISLDTRLVAKKPAVGFGSSPAELRRPADVPLEPRTRGRRAAPTAGRARLPCSTARRYPARCASEPRPGAGPCGWSRWRLRLERARPRTHTPPTRPTCLVGRGSNPDTAFVNPIFIAPEARYRGLLSSDPARAGVPAGMAKEPRVMTERAA